MHGQPAVPFCPFPFPALKLYSTGKKMQTLQILASPKITRTLVTLVNASGTFPAAGWAPGRGRWGLEGAHRGATGAVQHVGRLEWDSDRDRRGMWAAPAHRSGATSKPCLPQIFSTSAPSREEQKVFESWRKWLSGALRPGEYCGDRSSRGLRDSWCRGESSSRATARLWRAAINTDELDTYLDKESQ